VTGQQSSPFMAREMPLPIWLPRVVAVLGSAEYDEHGELRRWLWQDGEMGVVLDKHTHAYQAVVFTPVRSLTMRSVVEPSEAEVDDLVSVVGLADKPARRARRGGT
jgi:hypothetical protein